MKERFSGKLLLRIDSRLHKTLAARAAKERSSINVFCARLIEEGLIQEKSPKWWAKEAGEIASALKKKFGNRLMGVAVFGSQINGTATEESDVDLLIAIGDSVPLTRSLYSWWDETIVLESNVEFTPQFVHLPKNPNDAGGIWFEAATASEIVWESKRKLSSAIKILRKHIEDDLIRRHWLNGQPYWVRRNDEKQRSRQ